MVVFEFTFLGVDDNYRSVYKDQNGRLWKNIKLQEGAPEYCTCVNNQFYGEPNDPIEVLYDNYSVTLKNN